MLIRRRSPRRRERGQSLAEFALILPVFMLILAGIVQLGVLLWGQNTLNQLVRDAGRHAATLTTCSATAAEARITALAGAYSGPWTLSSKSAVYTPVGTGTPCPPDDSSQEVWVKITATYNVAVFFPVVPGGGQVTSTADFRVEPMP
jgi:Flp pilus assembly protein TadG